MKAIETEESQWMSPTNPVKLKKEGKVFKTTLAVQAHPGISIANDLFESQPTASWCKAWTENSETNKPSQVCTAARREKSCSQLASQRCERCPSLPLMRPRVVD